LLTTAGIDGIDLHGDERNYPPAPFAPLYAAARAQGYLTKAHAGELLGPEAVRDTLETLQVKRIAHGTTAAQDDTLVQRLIAEDVTLDIGLTSNVKLQVAQNVATHPIGTLLRRGVRVTVNTDDPAVFGCTLTDELLALVEHQQFTPHELAQLQRNAFRVAKLAEAQRQAIMAEIESLLTHMR
jgi:adenosine deaminase